MNKILYLGATGVAVIIALLILGNKVSDENKFQEKIENSYGIYALEIPFGIDFCQEDVPLHNMNVWEQLDRELLVNTYWQSNILLYFKRANKWFPLIEPILKQNNIPDDFKYLALIESGLQQVVSPSGAAGFWQFMKKTGQEYGLEVNTYVDERYHVEKATEAACKYIKDAYATFNNWTLVAASFNMGMSGLKKQLKNQGVNSYYDLYLNPETTRYIYRILAVKEIFSHPEKYGIHFENRHLYKQWPSKELIVDSSIENLYDFARSNGISYRELKLLNPWLRSYRLPNSTYKKYHIKIAKKRVRPAENDIIHPDSPKKIEPEFDSIFYTVKAHESLSNIADRYQVTDSLLKIWNKLDSQKIKKGQSLLILKPLNSSEEK